MELKSFSYSRWKALRQLREKSKNVGKLQANLYTKVFNDLMLRESYAINTIILN